MINANFTQPQTPPAHYPSNYPNYRLKIQSFRLKSKHQLSPPAITDLRKDMTSDFRHTFSSAMSKPCPLFPTFSQTPSNSTTYYPRFSPRKSIGPERQQHRRRRLWTEAVQEPEELLNLQSVILMEFKQVEQKKRKALLKGQIKCKS